MEQNRTLFDDEAKCHECGEKTDGSYECDECYMKIYVANDGIVRRCCNEGCESPIPKDCYNDNKFICDGCSALTCEGCLVESEDHDHNPDGRSYCSKCLETMKK